MFFPCLHPLEKVEAALNENTCRIEHELRSIPADSELNIQLHCQEKARMKDQVLFTFINIYSDFFDM